MPTTRAASPRAFLIFALCLSAFSFAQGTILFDGSGSMAGFAAADPQRLRGVVQRLHAGLATMGPQSTKLAFLRETQQGNRIDEHTLRDFAMIVGVPGSYKKDTPLQWGIEQARMTTDEFVIVTDGMETSGRINGIKESISQMIQSGWSVSLVAAAFPFRGLFYTEMSLNLKESLPLVRKEIQSAHREWDVSPGECETPGNCYFFNGQRPLLFLLFSRSADCSRLMNAVAQALSQNRLDATRRVQIAPFRPARVTTEIVPSNSEAKVQLRLPDLIHSETQFRCLVQDNKHLPIQIAVRASDRQDPDQPSELRLIQKKLVQKPAWVNEVKSVTDKPTTSPVFALEIVCLSQGVMGSFRSEEYIPLKDRLELRFDQEWALASRGWWIDMSSEDSWQNPSKVYKLAEIVGQLHEVALKRHRQSKPLSTTLVFSAAVRR